MVVEDVWGPCNVYIAYEYNIVTKTEEIEKELIIH